MNINDLILAADILVFGIIFILLILLDIPRRRSDSEEDIKANKKLRLRIALILSTIYIIVAILCFIGFFGPKP